MSGQVTDGVSTCDYAQYGTQSRDGPDNDRCGCRSDSRVAPDLAPPEVPGRMRGLVSHSRVRALNYLLPVFHNLRATVGTAVQHLLPQPRREHGQWPQVGEYRRA
jgi:hypothetical protein